MSAPANGATLSIISNNSSAILRLGTTPSRYGSIYAYAKSTVDLYSLDGSYGARLRVIANASLALQNIYMRGKIMGDGGGFNGCRIQIGYYTGNSSAQQTISGLEFTPLFIFIWYPDLWDHGYRSYYIF